MLINIKKMQTRSVWLFIFLTITIAAIVIFCYYVTFFAFKVQDVFETIKDDFTSTSQNINESGQNSNNIVQVLTDNAKVLIPDFAASIVSVILFLLFWLMSVTKISTLVGQAKSINYVYNGESLTSRARWVASWTRIFLYIGPTMVISWFLVIALIVLFGKIKKKIVTNTFTKINEIKVANNFVNF